MKMYKNGNRQQCNKCKRIKDADDFGNVLSRKVNAPMQKSKRCNECRQNGNLETMRKKEERQASQRREHWMDRLDRLDQIDSKINEVENVR